MRSFAPLIIFVAACVGCRAPGDARYSSAGRTVPPPSTGSFGVPDAYYNRQPATGTPTTPAANRTGTSLGYENSPVDTLDGGWRSAGANQVTSGAVPASYDGAVGTGLATGAPSFQASTSSTFGASNNSSTALRGMAVNDGTGFVEPQKFTAAAAREIGRTLAPPEIDFSAAQSSDAGGATTANSSGLSFRPPTIRRTNVETPTNTTYLR